MSASTNVSKSKPSLPNHQQLCDACGKPPYRDEDNRLIKMLRCSRCRAVWYHDVRCQRKHYKMHKHLCRMVSNNNTASPTVPKIISLYHCEHLDHHGRSMVASQTVSPGTRIYPSRITDGNKMTFFEAIVPPVLINSERELRCAHCFEKILLHNTQNFRTQILRYCSSECKKHGFKLDAHLFRLISSPLSNNLKLLKMLTPITLLLYRIVCSVQEEEINRGSIQQNETIKYRINQLVSNSDSEFALSEEEKQYRSFIAQSCLQLYRDTHDNNCVPFAIEELVEIVSKIIYNAFSITDGEQKTIGLGLYPDAAIINHSCAPNLVQTFAYGNGNSEAPKLVLTAFKKIEKGHEMFIAYTDPLEIYTKREAFCTKEYKFKCDCSRCTKSRYNRLAYNNVLNSQSVEVLDSFDSKSDILKCQTKGCCGFCYDHTILNYCELCTKRNQKPEITFMRVKQLRDETVNILQLISQKFSSLNSENRTVSSVSSVEISNAEQVFHEMKKYCVTDSWYVQESGKLLVDMIIQHIGYNRNDERERRRLCSQALVVLEELDAKTMVQSMNPLSTINNQLKMSKLLLYLDPDPTRAISILQKTMTTLLVYFPPGHEVITLAEELLKRAYQ